MAAATLTIRGIEQAEPIGELAAIAFDDLGHNGPTTLTCIGGQTITLSYVDADLSSSITAGDTLKVVHGSGCVGASRDISIVVTLADLTNLRLEGTVNFTADTAAGSHVTGTFTLSSTLDNVNFVFRQVFSNLSITSVAGGKNEVITAAQFERKTVAPSDYELTFSGSLRSESLGGTLAFSTPSPFTGTTGNLPLSGELVLTAGTTHVRVAATQDPLARQYVDYQVDTGSGYSAAQHARWRDVSTGLLFFWIPNDPPTITSLEVTPHNPTVEDLITATVTASDPDGDALSSRYVWQANGVTVFANDNIFSPSSLHRGDVVTVFATVTDGRADATANASVTIADAAPHITSLTLSPAAPRSIDDTTVVAAATDPDNDPVLFSYEWQKGGVKIQGQTAATLPHSTFQRGDVITAIVHATDGTTTTTQQTTFTVADSPPQVSVASPPIGAVYGMPVTFVATVQDPDGDSVSQLRFDLRYGPAGMTVDPTTGVVRWTATLPMFERTMTVGWGVGVSDPASDIVTGTFTLDDSARQYPLARAGIDPPQFGGLRIGDFDGDGDQEMLVLSSRYTLYELERSGAGYRVSWMYPFELNPGYQPHAMTTVDIDADNKQEIFVAAGPKIFRLDGANRRPSASVTLPVTGPFDSCSALLVADLDRDGLPELVCPASFDGSRNSNQSIVIVDPRTMTVKAQIPPGDYGYDFAVGNVDADPALEIVTSGGYVFDGATLAAEWVSPTPFGDFPAIGDTDGDGIGEIVANFGTTVRAFSARPQNRGPLYDVSTTGQGLIAITSVDGDASPEILVAGANLGAYRYNPVTKTVTQVFNLPLPSLGMSALAVGNVDQTQDARVEFVIGLTFAGLAIADFPSSGARIEWTSEGVASGPLIGPFYGGDLVKNVSTPAAPVFLTGATGNGTEPGHLFTMNPTTGDLRVSADLAANWSVDKSGALRVVDYDNNGNDEVFLGSADLTDTYFGVYDFFADRMLFRSPAFPSGRVADLAYGDINGDGKKDLVALTVNGDVAAYDVFTGAKIWSDAPGANAFAVAVADLNGTGGPEIIVATSERIVAYSRDANPSQPYRQIYATAYYTYSRDFVAGDIDGDGKTDLFLLHSDGAGNEVLQRFNERLEPTTSSTLTGGAQFIAIEGSPFSRKNLVATCADPNTGTGYSLRGIDPVTGAEIWRSPPLLGAPNRSVRYVDPAGTGVRIAYATEIGVFLTR